MIKILRHITPFGLVGIILMPYYLNILHFQEKHHAQGCKEDLAENRKEHFHPHSHNCEQFYFHFNPSLEPDLVFKGQEIFSGNIFKENFKHEIGFYIIGIKDIPTSRGPPLS